MQIRSLKSKELTAVSGKIPGLPIRSQRQRWVGGFLILLKKCDFLLQDLKAEKEGFPEHAQGVKSSFSPTDPWLLSNLQVASAQ